MPKNQWEPTKQARKRSWQIRFVSSLRRVRHGRWYWFDHPEMQARIEKAEADRLEGRFEKFDSREAALVYLNRPS